jgi:hypothetical protein
MASKHEITPETLPAVMWRDVKVITTELLATLYGTDGNSIRMNYARNASRFEEGKHFHKLEGTALREFKDRATDSGSVVGKNARSLVLWTERGAARHAKMLETDQAWDVFEKLEDCYFRRRESSNDDENELSTVRDRRPLYHGAVDIVVTYRLSFGKAYQALNWYAGSDGFPRMTKRQASEAAGFVRRFLAGDATQRDFERIETNRAALAGESPQMQLIGVTIPLIYGRES